MKIVHILPALTKGGGERVAVDLANAAADAGHEVAMLLAYPVDSRLLQHRLNSKVELQYLCDRPSRLRPYLALPRWLRGNWEWIASRDIVHCHLTFGTVAGSLIQARRRRRRDVRPAVVETYHAAGMNIPAWKRGWDRAQLSRRDAVALVAEDAFWASFRKSAPDGRVRVIPNGVSINAEAGKDAVAEFRALAGIPQGAMVVGSIGRLVAERRPDKIFDAFVLASTMLPPNVHLLLGGDGPERKVLQDRAQKAGLESRVHLPGHIANPAAVFPLIDLYLTVNIGPVTGIAAIEAAMSGCPIIAYQMSGGDHSRADEWIWSSASVEAIAERLTGLLTNADERPSLARSQRDYVLAHHGVESMAKSYDALYDSAARFAVSL